MIIPRRHSNVVGFSSDCSSVTHSDSLRTIRWRSRHVAVLSGLLLVMLIGGCQDARRVGSSSPAVDKASASQLNRAGNHVMGHDSERRTEFNTEAYDVIHENPFFTAIDQPLSTFSIDVDTASYANVRRFLEAGQRPPPGAVRLEELVNYFDYDYPSPTGEHPFAVHSELAPCPWNPEHLLLRIGLRGFEPKDGDRPRANLVFLVDVSGSMAASNKLPLVQSALRLLTQRLASDDRIAIVVYAGDSGIRLESTEIASRARILDAIDSLHAGGSTNGGEGIQLAYRTAQEHFVEQGINRVILCSDGDFNVGITDQSRLVKLIEEMAESNVFLSVLGFGQGNLKDSTMEQLADHGNGVYAYIDGLSEARKVLADGLGGTLQTIAKDVKIQLDFNPQHVHAYRLLGYENRHLENRDFRDDAKDAGDMGAGHAVTAFFELIVNSGEVVRDIPGSDFVSNEIRHEADAHTWLNINLRYKRPAERESAEFQRAVVPPHDPFAVAASDDFRFASAVLAYGMLLRNSQYRGNAAWDWIIETARDTRGHDRNGLRAEFVHLAELAQSVVGEPPDKSTDVSSLSAADGR